MAALVSSAARAATWLLLVLGLASALYLVWGDTVSPTVPRSWPGIAYGWWIALVFCLAQLGIGRRARSLIGGRAAHSGNLQDCLFSITVGFWLTSIVAMTLAASGLLEGPAVALYLVAAILISVDPGSWRWSRLRSRIWGGPGRGRPAALAVLIAALGLLLPYLLQTVLPNSDWDGASTHLPLARWFESRGLAEIPLDYSNLIIPGSVHLIYAMFLAVGAEQAIVPLNFLFSLLTCVAAAALAERFWGKAAGWWTLGVALTTNLILELGLDPRIDGFLGFFCTMAALGILEWVLGRSRPDKLVMAGMALGLALGSKYTAVIPLALWALPVVWVVWRERGRPRKVKSRAVLLALVCVVVPSGYWYLSNTVSWGDPLYPRLRGELMRSSSGQPVPLRAEIDRMLSQTDGVPGFRAILSETQSLQSEYQPPRNLFDLRSLFLEPECHSRKPGHTLSPLLLLFVLLPLLRRDRASWFLLWMGLSVGIVIGMQTYLVRYGLVFYPLLAAGAGVVLAATGRRWWRVGWATVLIVFLIVNLTEEWRQVQRQRVAPWLSGKESRIEWLRQVGYNGATEMPEMISAVLLAQDNGTLPLIGKTLMLGEAKSHLLGFGFLPDISRTATPWLAYLARHEGDLDLVHRELWADGVRHVLVNLGYFGWVRGNVEIHAQEYALSLATLRKFVEDHAEVAISTSGIILVHLTEPAP